MALTGGRHGAGGGDAARGLPLVRMDFGENRDDGDKDNGNSDGDDGDDDDGGDGDGNVERIWRRRSSS